MNSGHARFYEETGSKASFFFGEGGWEGWGGEGRGGEGISVVLTISFLHG